MIPSKESDMPRLIRALMAGWLLASMAAPGWAAEPKSFKDRASFAAHPRKYA